MVPKMMPWNFTVSKTTAARALKLLWQNLPPAVLAAFIAFAVIELFGDRTIETIHALSVTPNPVKAGALATIIYQGKQDNNCDGTVHRWIVDARSTLIQLDDAPIFHHEIDEKDPDKTFTFTKSLPVPGGLVPGTATYHAEAVRWCNAFQQFLWPVRDHYVIKFEIVK